MDSLKTFHSFEDAIYNDLPLIASDAGRLRDGSPAQEERFSVFGAKHRCSRKSIKRPAPVCIEFEREIRVRTVPNPGRVDFICRSFSAYLYRVCVHRQLVISTSPRASREILATNCRELVGKYDVTTCLSTAGPSTR